MGSPGTFIHSGTLGGRLSVLEALAPLNALPVSAVLPITAALRRSARRDVPFSE